MATRLHWPKQATLEAATVAVGALAFGLLFSIPLLEHLTEAFFSADWDFCRDHDWTDLYIVTHFHQFPLWSPYQCGGMEVLGSPQSRILSPFFLLHLIAGSTVGLHLEVPLHLAIAWAGGYVLGRSLHLRPLASIACATVFPSSSWFYLHLGAGHLDFISFAYTPWTIAFTLLAIERKRIGWAAAAASTLALAIFEGGIHPTAETAIFVIMLTAILAVMGRDRWPLMVLAAAGLFTIGFAAVKLVPACFLSMQFTRPTGSTEYLSLSGYATSLFSRNQYWSGSLLWLDTGSMSIVECGAYLSLPFLVAAAVGVWASPRRSLPWTMIALAFLLLGMGSYFGPVSPWVLLHPLPVFSWLRISPRFFIMLPLCLGVLAGLGIEFMQGGRSGFGTAIAVCLLAAGAVDCWLIGPRNLVIHLTGPEESLPTAPVFRQFEDPDQQMFRVNLANMGISNCYPGLLAATGKVAASNRPGYRGEEYLLGPGSLSLAHWTPQILDYDVEVKSATVMVVNQNYDYSWKLAKGRGEVFSYNGLLAVRLPPGTQRIRLRYSRYQFIAGLAISLVTVLVALVSVASSAIEPVAQSLW
jgi:hypothetical protein